MSKFDFKDLNNLNLLENTLVEIRLISKESNRLPDKEKLILINQLAELSHNIPNIIAQNGNLNFLDDQANKLENYLMELPKKKQEIYNNIKCNENCNESIPKNIDYFNQENERNLNFLVMAIISACLCFLIILVSHFFGIPIIERIGLN